MARGFVHIGVLKVLEEQHLAVDLISGTSMGGLLAAMYAMGMSVADIEAEALRISNFSQLVRLLDPTPARRGFLDGGRVRRYLTGLIGEKRQFEDLAIPLALCSVDINSAQEIVFTKGPLLPAVLSTIAMPGLFPPIVMEERCMVDGGVLNNLPVEPLHKMGAEKILAIDAHLDPSETASWIDGNRKEHFPVPVPDFFVEFYRSCLIMVAEITRSRLDRYPPDLLIRPELAQNITMFLGFSHAAEAIDVGEQAMRAALPKLQAILDSPKEPSE